MSETVKMRWDLEVEESIADQTFEMLDTFHDLLGAWLKSRTDFYQVSTVEREREGHPL